MDMLFNAVLQRISSRLKAIAHKYTGYCMFIDNDDLFQETSLHLWDRYQKGEIAGKNDAYLVQSCKFHILNYLRKNKPGVLLVSMDELMSDDGDTLKDTIPDIKAQPIASTVSDEMQVAEIRDSSASDKETTIMKLLEEGHTVREIGKKLGISHVMVIKYKKKDC